MLDKVEIINQTNMSLDISDIGVQLPGRGSRKVVAIATADKSPILSDFKKKKWVSCKIYREAAVSYWPFHKVPVPPRMSEPNLIPDIPKPPRSPSFDNLITELMPQPAPPQDGQVLGEIRDLLQTLVNKSSVNTAPEVIAAHVASAIVKSSGSPALGAIHVDGKLGGVHDDAPKFVPSRIMPEENVDLSIKTQSQELQRSDFEDAAIALRAMRKQAKEKDA